MKRELGFREACLLSGAFAVLLCACAAGFGSPTPETDTG